MELEARVISNGAVLFDWGIPESHLAADTVRHLEAIFSRQITTNDIHLISSNSRVEVRMKYENRRAK